MGCPDFYYKEMLQSLVYCLYSDDITLAERLQSENDIEKLEQYIREKKETMPA